jgi:putative PIG3 family NAD(P)H quinone oxidoreductase
VKRVRCGKTEGVRAITVSQPGGPEVLTWAEVPDPQPAPDEVLVEVTAAAVNRADTMQRQGHYPPPPGASPYLGLECSGRVIDRNGHTEWFDGQEVCALLAGGGYAEKVAVPVGQLLPVPQKMSLTEAAALPEVACTVWSNIVQFARLKSGETILIHGGGSGIGTFAIQLAKALGATVVTTARKAKHDRLIALGADRAIDYQREDFAESTTADVILDIMGAKYLADNVKALAPDGRLAMIGMQGGRKGEIDLGLMLAKRATLATTALRSRPKSQKAQIIQGVLAEVWPMVEDGRIKPVVDRTFPLEQAAQAHELVERSDHFGKVVLTREAA